jgi:hypothetical protein
MKKSSVLLMSAAVLGTIAMTAPQAPVHAATTTNMETSTLTPTTVKTVTAGPNGAMVASDPASANTTGRLLPAGSHWKVFGTTTINGVSWYNLGGQQWVLAREVAKGYSYTATRGSATDGTRYPNESKVSLTLTAGPNGAQIFTAPNNYTATSRILPAGSHWRAFNIVQDGDATWYNLGGDQWVAASEVAKGNSYIGVALTGDKGVLKINYVRGYGIVVWNKYLGGQAIAGKKLQDGSKWKYFGTATFNGRTWYNLGGNQWIDGRYAHVLQ